MCYVTNSDDSMASGEDSITGTNTHRVIKIPSSKVATNNDNNKTCKDNLLVIITRSFPLFALKLSPFRFSSLQKVKYEVTVLGSKAPKVFTLYSCVSFCVLSQLFWNYRDEVMRKADCVLLPIYLNNIDKETFVFRRRSGVRDVEILRHLF